jgi:hypothetical protein
MEIKRGRFAKELEDPFYLKDQKLLELYNKCLPPKEAYYYFPKGEEIIELNTKKPNKSYRKIYHNTPYSDIEKQFLNEFKKKLNEHPELKIPEFIDDDILLRFIYADECDYDKVYKRLEKYIDWSNKTFPIIIQPKSRLIEILNKGICYFYGRDCRYRPILVFRLQEFVKYEKVYSVQEVMEAGCFLGQFGINNMMIPGQVERWNLLINLKGATVLSLPEHIKKLIPVMNEAFISRLNKNYILGMTFFLRFLFKIVCTFLHESTVKKIKILDGKKDKRLFEEIRKDNIEQCMGGTAPDAKIGEENGLFPPRMPSEHFLLESERPENILISEEEYIQKYKNGEIPNDLASPYILEKLNININNKNGGISLEEKKLEKSENELKSNKINVSMSNDYLRTINNREKNISKNGKQLNIIKEKNLEILKLKQLKEQNIYRVKTFLYHGWNYNEEHENIQKYSSYHKNTIINDLYSLSQKKNNFCKKMNKISNKRK